MTCTVIGGCGYVGNALARQLLADGQRVVGIRRDPRGLAPGIAPIAGDLAAPASLGPAPTRIDLAVFAAAADAGTEDAYRRTYVDGLRGFLAWLGEQQSPPRRVVLTSSTSVYGQSRGEPVDESSPTEPGSFRGATMLLAERLLADSGLPGVVLRLGGIYGPGRAQVLERARRGELQSPPAPHFTNRIHLDDAAGALRHLLLLPAPDALYLGVDDEPSEQGAFHDWLAQTLGAPRPRPAATTTPTRGSKRCSNARLRASGYSFRYPTYREGYGALIARADL